MSQVSPETYMDDPDAELRREAARLMGRARTRAKSLAARQNGKLGGRPKGIPVSEETRQKISAARRKHIANHEHFAPKAANLSAPSTSPKKVTC